MTGLAEKPKLSFALRALLAVSLGLTACGGGGDAEPFVDLSGLVGVDTSVTVQPYMSCFYPLTAEQQVAGRIRGKMIVEKYGNSGLNIAFTLNNYSAIGYTYQLKYSSGDNVNGYVFTGKSTNISTKEESEVYSTSIKNTTSDGLMVTGNMSVRVYGAFCGTTYSIR